MRGVCECRRMFAGVRPARARPHDPSAAAREAVPLRNSWRPALFSPRRLAALGCGGFGGRRRFALDEPFEGADFPAENPFIVDLQGMQTVTQVADFPLRVV